jgi:hypothetical protein
MYMDPSQRATVSLIHRNFEVENKKGGPVMARLLASQYDVCCVCLRLGDRYDETESVRADPESGALRLKRRKPIQ